MSNHARDVDDWIRRGIRDERAPERPVELTPVIMDWDIHQWAAAIERCGIGGTTIKYMDKLRKEYVRRYKCETLAHRILGANYADQRSYGLAKEVFRHTELIEYVNLEAESLLAGMN